MSKNTCFTFETTRLTTTPPSSVCPLATSPCVRSTRLRVCRHHAHMFRHMCAWCRYTRRRFERTHEDVLSGRTGFSACYTPHTTHHIAHTHHTTTQDTTHHNTPHNNTTTTPHENRERESREKTHFQCGGAWPCFVDVVLCLVHPVNDRVFCLLNRVKYDCFLISFSASWPVNIFFFSANYFIYSVTVFNFIF